MSVLLDTSALFAFLYDGDADHDAAVVFLKDVWGRKHGTPFVSTWIIDELLTLIRTRTKSKILERSAHELLLGPDPALAGVKLVAVGPDRLAAIWIAFDRYRDRGLSATDVSHLILMEEYGIDALATFEAGFQGLVHVVPG